MKHVAIVFLVLTLSAAASAAPDRAQVQARLRAQLAKGQARLTLEGLPPFDAVTLAEARETPSGHFTGRIGFGKSLASALLHFVPEKAGSKTGTWVLALRPDALSFTGLAPHLRGSIVSQLALSTPVLAFSTSRVAAAEKTLGPEVVTYYGGFARRFLKLQKGVNLLTVASPAKSSAVERAFELLALGEVQLNLQGVLLRDFDGRALKEAYDKGQLKAALRRGSELRATLPEIRLKGLPPSFQTGAAYLFVTGEPGVGVGFSMTLRDKHGLREFDCALSIGQDLTQVTELVVVAGTEGRWPNALGLRGFNLDKARLLLGIDTAQRVALGLEAQMGIGGKRLAIAGKVKVHALTGAVTQGIFQGELSSIGVRDLLSAANSVKPARSKALKLGGIPTFSLRGVKVLYAPMGGDHRLGIKTGMALKGKLIALNRPLMDVDAFIDQSTVIPTIKVKGKAGKVNLGVMALNSAAVDINIGVTADPRFKVQGVWRQWLTQRRLDVDLSRSGLSFEAEEKIGGVYRARFKARSPKGGKKDWLIAASMQNDFSKTLEKDVSRRALAWANKVKRDAARAEASVRTRRKAVEGLSRQIEAAKRQVRAERAAELRRLRDAEAKVKSLDAQIAARKKVVDRRQAPLRKAAADLKARRDRAQRSYKAALRKRKATIGPAIIPAKADEAAKWSALQEAKASYEIASGKLAKSLARVDPQLQSLQAARGAALVAVRTARTVYRKTVAVGPVELDPRVAGLITSRETGRGALLAAEAAVRGFSKALIGAAQVTAFAVRHQNKLLTLRSASFRASLAGFKRGGRVSLAIRVSFLGKNRALTLKANATEIARGKVFQGLWKRLEKTLK